MKPKTKRWSKHVTETSHALALEENVFKKESPKDIARSLKRSAERSRARKSDPYRSAMSMLTFYINRGGKNLPPRRKRVLERAKAELRTLYHRDSPDLRRATGRARPRARRARVARSRAAASG